MNEKIDVAEAKVGVLMLFFREERIVFVELLAVRAGRSDEGRLAKNVA